MASWLGEPVRNFNFNGEDVYFGYFPLNYAFIIINTTLQNLGVYSVGDDCFNCPFKRVNIHYGNPGESAKFTVYTGQQNTWKILNSTYYEELTINDKPEVICELKPTLGGYGVYSLDVTGGSCALETLMQPANIYLPLLLFSFILLSFVMAFGLIKFLRRRSNEAKCNDGLNLTVSQDNLDNMASLHFFRGLLLMLIIFVTTGGGGYPIFIKNLGGLTVAEVLFFSFTLTIGIQVPIIFDDECRKARSKCSVFGPIFVRSVILCILDVAIAETVRDRDRSSRFHEITPLWGPLSRFGISYLVVATVYMFSRKSQIQEKSFISKVLANVTSLLWSWVIAAFLLFTMIISTYVFYSVKCKEVQYSYTNCRFDVFDEVLVKNTVGMPDRDDSFSADTYFAYTERLLGLISSILTALIGLKAGVTLVQQESHSDRMKLIGFWATLLGFAAIILAYISSALEFNLWPISTIFFCSSMTLYVYTLIYYFTDVLRVYSTIIATFGVASIATLSGHLLFSQSVPFNWDLVLYNHFMYLCQCAWIVGLWVILTVCWMRWRIFFITRVVLDEKTRRAILAL